MLLEASVAQVSAGNDGTKCTQRAAAPHLGRCVVPAGLLPLLGGRRHEPHNVHVAAASHRLPDLQGCKEGGSLCCVPHTCLAACNVHAGACQPAAQRRVLPGPQSGCLSPGTPGTRRTGPLSSSSRPRCPAAWRAPPRRSRRGRRPRHAWPHSPGRLRAPRAGPGAIQGSQFRVNEGLHSVVDM